jgi:hypothetical protein
MRKLTAGTASLSFSLMTNIDEPSLLVIYQNAIVLYLLIAVGSICWTRLVFKSFKKAGVLYAPLMPGNFFNLLHCQRAGLQCICSSAIKYGLITHLKALLLVAGVLEIHIDVHMPYYCWSVKNNGLKSARNLHSTISTWAISFAKSISIMKHFGNGGWT